MTKTNARTLVLTETELRLLLASVHLATEGTNDAVDPIVETAVDFGVPEDTDWHAAVTDLLAKLS